jgi:hypothetical protein
MLLCTAEVSGLFLPYRLGKLVIMVSIDGVSCFTPREFNGVLRGKTYFRSVSTAIAGLP